MHDSQHSIEPQDFESGERHGEFALGIALLADRSPAFAEALPTAEPWRLHLAYAAIEMCRKRLLADTKKLGDVLANAPLKRVGLELFRAPLPGLRRSLGRIGPFPMRAGSYRLLGSALACSVRRKPVFHAPQVTSTLLALLASLPDEAISGRILAWDHGDPHTLYRIKHAVSAIRTALVPAHALDAWRALAALDDMRGLDDWLHERLGEMAFSPPPWGGTATIKPVRTLGELRKIAGTFRNCLWQQRTDNIAGLAHIYLCQEPGVEAVAAVYRDEFLGWYLAEVKGAANQTLSPEAMDYLVSQFAVGRIQSMSSTRRHWLP